MLIIGILYLMMYKNRRTKKAFFCSHINIQNDKVGHLFQLLNIRYQIPNLYLQNFPMHMTTGHLIFKKYIFYEL
jgi:hypothetical protein